MTAVKGFNEISYDELMDVNGGGAISWVLLAVAVGVIRSCTDRVVDHVIDEVMGESW